MPAPNFDDTPLLFQRPFFRLIGQGRAWVAIFFVLLGFVNSLKAVRQIRDGLPSEAMQTLALSAFRRTGRLVFPAAAVTVIVWFVTQFGVFNFALNADSFWLRTTGSWPSDTWGIAIDDLIRQLASTWLYGSNAYDQPQWALLSLFKGSLYVYIVLLATVHTSPHFRLFAEAALYIYSTLTNDCIVGTNVYFGMILAELSFLPLQKIYNRTPLPLKFLPYATAVLGLYLCSYPDDYTTYALWSRQLQDLGLNVLPPGTDLGRFWTGLGAQILCVSVQFHPHLRSLLSRRPLLYLGSISYPLYLLHGPLMRSLLAWMAIGPIAWNYQVLYLEDGSVDPDQKYPLPRPLAFLVILPVFWILMFFVVEWWSCRVEPIFGRMTAAFERFATSVGRDELNEKVGNGGIRLENGANGGFESRGVEEEKRRELERRGVNGHGNGILPS